MIFTHRHYGELKQDYVSGVIESDMPLFLLQAWPAESRRQMLKIWLCVRALVRLQRLWRAQIGCVITPLKPYLSLILWSIITLKLADCVMPFKSNAVLFTLRRFWLEFPSKQLCKLWQHNKGNPYSGVMSSRLRATCAPFWCAKWAVTLLDPSTAAAEVETESVRWREGGKGWK